MRKPIRAVAIILHKNQVLLIKRNNNGKKYYTFPSGGVEENETVENAVIREVFEETTLQIKIEKLIYHHHYINNSDQYFYLCNYVSGEPKLGDCPEKKGMEQGSGNLYEPLWIDITKINELLLYPLEIRDWLLDDVKNNFKNTPRKMELNVKDIRQNL